MPPGMELKFKACPDLLPLVLKDVTGIEAYSNEKMADVNWKMPEEDVEMLKDVGNVRKMSAVERIVENERALTKAGLAMCNSESEVPRRNSMEKASQADPASRTEGKVEITQSKANNKKANSPEKSTTDEISRKENRKPEDKYSAISTEEAKEAKIVERSRETNEDSHREGKHEEELQNKARMTKTPQLGAMALQLKDQKLRTPVPKIKRTTFNNAYGEKADEAEKDIVKSRSGSISSPAKPFSDDKEHAGDDAGKLQFNLDEASADQSKSQSAEKENLKKSVFSYKESGIL